MHDAQAKDDIPSALTRKAEESLDAVSRLCRHALDEAGYPADKPVPEALSISITPELTSEGLAEQVTAAAREAASLEHPIVAGSVYCFHCSGASCGHARPRDAGNVFAGYDNSGRPVWQEFFNALIGLDDDRIDLLFSARPNLLARVIGRQRLIADQTVACGRNTMTYRILAEVVAGYIVVQRQRCAITVQVVETSDHMLHVQTITSDDVRQALADSPANDRSRMHRIHNALRRLKNEIDCISILWEPCADKNKRKTLTDRIFTTLNHLAHSIEQKGRQASRRSGHAEMRSRENRPVHKASDDVATASVECFFRDNLTGTVVVMGKNGRFHVFNDSGKLITSLNMSADQIERRQRRKRYTPLPKNEAELVRTATRTDDK